MYFCTMFTGIIEALATVKQIETEGTNKHFWLSVDFVEALKVDQSLAHNGVCLTVVEIKNGLYRVTAVNETLERSNLGILKPGDLVNVERCMKADSRLDGHIVQGHVDTKGRVLSIKEENGSWLFTFSFESQGNLLVEKGSVTVNGTSLTCFDVEDDRFSVAIIPYTYSHTNFNLLKPEDSVNLEFDIIGKYVQRMINAYNSQI